jgi:hypothetical protein
MDRSRTRREEATWLRQQAILALLALGAAAPFALLASLVPSTLVLACMSLLALSIAALTAAYAAWRGLSWTGETVTAWDVAGGLAFIGFSAAMLSEPANILPITAVAMN